MASLHDYNQKIQNTSTLCQGILFLQFLTAIYTKCIN